MIYHEGKAVLRYYQPVPKYVRIADKEYVCDVRHGVSLLFVKEDEVYALLKLEGGCCDGKKQVFSEASQEAFNVWLTGNR